MLHTVDRSDELPHAAQDVDIMTMGITPSGNGMLHMGHYMTLYNLLRALSLTRTASAKLFVDDREFSLEQNPSMPPHSAVSNTTACIRNMVARTDAFFAGEHVSGRVEIINMSDFFNLPGINNRFTGMDMYELFARGRQVIGRSFVHMHLSTTAAVPLCPDCGKFEWLGRWKTRRDLGADGVIRAKCVDPDCSVGDYQVDVSSGDDNWAIFYMMVGLRDILMSRCGSSVLHFYGGDYAQEWGLPLGNSMVAKVDRIRHLVSGLGSKIGGLEISHVVGPMLVAGDSKLSKSRGDYGDVPDLELLDSILCSRQGIYDISRRSTGLYEHKS